MTWVMVMFLGTGTPLEVQGVTYASAEACETAAKAAVSGRGGPVGQGPPDREVPFYFICVPGDAARSFW